MGQVYFTTLMERNIPDHAFANFQDIAMRAGALGYTRISLPYTRVDVARNRAVESFRKLSERDDDLLVMMDCDHTHPPDVLECLDADKEGVVAALAFRRCLPFDPQMYRYGPAGEFLQPSDWEDGLVEVDAFGMAAVAIRRWVFDKLDAVGMTYPYFRFWYPKGSETIFPSEDIYFGLACKAAKVPCYVDTRIICPHLSATLVDDSTWKDYLADHPEYRVGSDQRLPADLKAKFEVPA